MLEHRGGFITTIIYANRKILSDGQMSFGDRVDSLSVKKVRKINGCLVAGAGRLASIYLFFDWFQNWSDAQVVQSESPHVQVLVPEGIDDEDFTGLVIFPDETIFLYEGGKKSYQLSDVSYYAIGSGADFALAALDAGATPEEALAVAIKRDCFSGGDTFVEELDEEEEELTREKAESMDKEDLLDFIWGKKNTEDAVILANPFVSLYRNGILRIYTSEADVETMFDHFEINLDEETDGNIALINELYSKDYLSEIANSLEIELLKKDNKSAITSKILQWAKSLVDAVKEVQNENN